ncbi:class I SAM-dependent methyltransferase [Kibdelosporangium philippinense]|uniref:Class I SAM-dependent methyltransferase n=1 Tax=Kibdelosporangium philippinense TaxID=211113 RepID=A0ABS8ZIU6_9PSEU|nr:class I SAM-dependent methyltransferase [Kibdelosporangium philippinense]MCE7007701.1 class I SAM-dependent methyltransferase [Kibdelosporangium philippinense]
MLLAGVRPDDVVPSPNIWHWPELYEVENRAQDVDGEIWRVLAERCEWTGLDVLDLGCGDGFHLPRFAETARAVHGVEPHIPLVRRARQRVANLSSVEVMVGAAQRIPLPDACVDVVHARTAYFFGPGCEPGLAEADRVLRPGGVLAIVDLDGRGVPYGDWLRADLPKYDPVKIEEFFADEGFDSRDAGTTWRFENRKSLEAVLRIEFSAPVAAKAIASVGGLSFPVGYRVRTRRKPSGLVHPDR